MSFGKTILIAVAIVILMLFTIHTAYRVVMDYVSKYLMRFLVNEHMLLQLLKDMDRTDLLQFHEESMEEIDKIAKEGWEDADGTN